MRNKKGQFVKGSNEWLGKKHSQATREKLKLNHKGFLGKKHTKEARLKISVGMQGMIFSKEHIDNLRKSHLNKNTGEQSASWKGNKAGYGAIHDWVRKWKGRPETCEKCGKSGLTGRKIGWANIDHEYSRVLDEYIRLCVKCHREFDRKRGVIFKSRNSSKKIKL